MKLENYLHDRFSETGEILSGQDLAGEIARFEIEEAFRFLTPEEIFSAVIAASESFVDSMVENHWESKDRFEPEAFQAELRRLEGLRPKNRRTAEVLNILTTAI